jgi:hypothetical protein
MAKSGLVAGPGPGQPMAHVTSQPTTATDGTEKPTGAIYTKGGQSLGFHEPGLGKGQLICHKDSARDIRSSQSLSYLIQFIEIRSYFKTEDLKEIYDLLL